MLQKQMDDVAGPGTIVGSNVKLIGTLRDSNDIVIYGTIEGEVISEKLITVGESAVIRGPVNGENVIVSGTVKGSVTASQKLEITNSGKISGNIKTKDLLINTGAIFIGKCEMPDKDGFSKAEAKTEAKEEKPAEEIAAPAQG